MEAQPMFDTKPLLRPAQAEDAKAEIKTLEAQLQSPHIEDKGEVSRKLRRVRKTVEDQLPQPPVSGEEEGRMVRRSTDLLNTITVGMPSQEEMRKAPPGAVDKHMKWEARNKRLIQEWKNLQLRLKPGEAEAANLERHRPVGSSLGMDNAYIPGKQFYFPRGDVGVAVTFSDEQIAVLRALDPALADKLGMLSNVQRAEVKEILTAGESLGLSATDAKRAAGGRGAMTPERTAKQKRRYPVRTPEERKAWGEKMKLARAAKRAA